MSRYDTSEGATDDILGQFCFALGQGAGAIRIQRDAIAALRRRYENPVAAALDRWPALAPNILSFVSQVGRVAALQATLQGRTAINAADFTYARRLVESQVHKSADRSESRFAGIICPPLPGEQVPESTKDSPTSEDSSPLIPITTSAVRTIH